MPVVSTSLEALGEVEAWRHDFHAHPELMYDVHRTSGLVAERLRAFGCDEVVTGIGRTGVVGLIHGRKASGRTVGLRADMDALPIQEATDLPYASKQGGKMHACGHDGHSAMLLGAARHLCQTREFSGTAVVVFQPAEEGGAGGRAMVEDGLMERFAIDEIYGMHNLPGLAVGHFATRPGPIMAAADRFEVLIDGIGGHAANPHQCADPIFAAAQIVSALQGIVSRNVDPLDSCVLSVTQINAGSAQNAIPPTARLAGTIRTLKAETRRLAEKRLRAVVSGLAVATDVSAIVNVSQGYPVTCNDPDRASFCLAVAKQVSGSDSVDPAVDPMMGAEDFSYMLQKRPGAFMFLGNGGSHGLHHPAYDFNDAAIPFGVLYWVRLVEMALPLGI